MTTLKYPHNIFVVTPYLKKKIPGVPPLGQRLYFRMHYIHTLRRAGVHLCGIYNSNIRPERIRPP